eukprot:6212227-Pleurochrysis_carterae.AAC.5
MCVPIPPLTSSEEEPTTAAVSHKASCGSKGMLLCLFRPVQGSSRKEASPSNFVCFHQCTTSRSTMPHHRIGTATAVVVNTCTPLQYLIPQKRS